MGINRLMAFLRGKVPDVVVKVPARSLKGQRVAVDLSIIMCAARAVAHYHALNNVDIIQTEGQVDIEALDSHTISSVYNTLRRMHIDLGIQLVLVLDGKSPDSKKEHATKRRQTIATRSKTELKAIEELIAAAKAGASTALVAAPHSETQVESDMPWDDLDGLLPTAGSANGAYEYYAKYMTALRKCWYDSFDKNRVVNGITTRLNMDPKMKDVIIIRANGEADGLCASLFLEGRVNAIYSTDSDLLVRGCTFLITSMWSNEEKNLGSNTGQSVATVTKLDHNVLSHLGMTRSQLIETSIMAGCDYNDSIPSISFGKAYIAIKEYGTIENYATSRGIDVSCLHAERCRQEFRYVPSRDLIDGNLPAILLRANIPPTSVATATTATIDSYLRQHAVAESPGSLIAAKITADLLRDLETISEHGE